MALLALHVLDVAARRHGGEHAGDREAIVDPHPPVHEFGRVHFRAAVLLDPGEELLAQAWPKPVEVREELLAGFVVERIAVETSELEKLEESRVDPMLLEEALAGMPRLAGQVEMKQIEPIVELQDFRIREFELGTRVSADRDQGNGHDCLLCEKEQSTLYIRAIKIFCQG